MSKKIVSGHGIGKEICKLLGIQSDAVRSVNIYLPANEAAIVTINEFVFDENREEMIDIFKEYRLIEVDPDMKKEGAIAGDYQDETNI